MRYTFAERGGVLNRRPPLLADKGDNEEDGEGGSGGRKGVGEGENDPRGGFNLVLQALYEQVRIFSHV